MCVITTAMAGTTTAAVLANASLAATALSAGLSAYGSYQQGRQQSAMAQFQADQAAANARAARAETDVAEAQQRRKVAQTLGTQRAALAASGADISDTDTSAMNILGDTVEWGDYDARITRYNGEMKAWNFQNQGNAYAAQAKQYSTAGAIGAGASLLSGASKVASGWYSYKNGGR